TLNSSNAPVTINQLSSVTWVGASTGNWGTASNWTNGITPTTAVGSLIPNVATVYVGGNTISINIANIAGNIVSNNATLTVSSSSLVLPTLNITGPVKLGSGITTTGSQTYNEAVTLNTNIALITTNSDVTFNQTVNSDGTARTLSVSTGNGNVNFNGDVGNVSALSNITINTNQLTANNITLAGNLNITITGASEINGVISNGTSPASLTLNGGGSLALFGNNTYTGATTIANGTLLLVDDGQISNSSQVNITSASGVFDISESMSSAGAIINDLQGSGRVNLGDQYLTLKNAQSTYSGVITGLGGLNIDGGNLTLTGKNTYSGSTTIASAATLNLGIDNALSSTNLMINGGTLNIGDFDAKVGDVIIVSGSINGGTGVLYGTSFTLGEEPLIAAYIEILDTAPILTYSLPSTTTWSKKSSSHHHNDNEEHEKEDSHYKKIKTEKVITLAAEDCNLISKCRGSSMRLGKDNHLGKYLIRILDGAYLDLNGHTISNKIELNGFGIGSGSLINSSVTTTATTSGDILLGSSKYQLKSGEYSDEQINPLVGIGATGNIILSGKISGSGSLTKNGDKVLTLSENNSYTGATTINAGTLFVSGDIDSTKTITNIGTFVLGANAIISEVVSSGTINLNKYILSVNSGNISGLITDAIATPITNLPASSRKDKNIYVISYYSNSSGTGSIIKSGLSTNTLYLSYANTYSGTTTLNAGTVAITNESALGKNPSGTTINSGATLDISGNITLAESFSISGTGVLKNTINQGAIHFSGGVNYLTGTITLNNNATIRNDSSGTQTISSLISSASSKFTLTIESSSGGSTTATMILVDPINT
ncbi:MAG: hypothetical protein EBS46_02780, partial [Proteobacteria bacterium]|nr:hypothetical protein [Candidatus Fonsibacter sp. PEL4]